MKFQLKVFIVREQDLKMFEKHVDDIYTKNKQNKSRKQRIRKKSYLVCNLGIRVDIGKFNGVFFAR